MTISLLAVYIPTIFMTGPAAVNFKEFAFTLAGAVLISGFVALTLTPMMCSRLLEHRQSLTSYEQRLERIFNRLRLYYRNCLQKILKIPQIFNTSTEKVS